MWLVVPLVGYGWGYRRWGAPYPRYIQRRNAERARIAGDDAAFNHFAWGRRGDLVWTALGMGSLWLLGVLLFMP